MPYKSVNQNYEEKLQRLNKRQKEERNSLRYDKLVTQVATKILNKNDKRLSFKDWEEIATKVYNKGDRVTTTRVKRMMSTDIAKQDINITIRKVLLEKGYNEQKIAELITKAEEKARSTKDFLDIIREMKDILGVNEKTSVKESWEAETSELSDNYEKGMKEKRKLTVTKTKNRTGQNDSENNDTEEN